jgi:hypothetical protein
LDPDPDWIRIGVHPKMLDPDPDEINADPQPWFKVPSALSEIGKASIRIRIQNTDWQVNTSS